MLSFLERNRSKPTLLQTDESCIEWQKIACGSFHMVGVSREGDLLSWGCGKNGRLGHGNTDSITNPQNIEKALFSKNVQDVACGSYHTIVLTTEGDVYTW